MPWDFSRFLCCAILAVTTGGKRLRNPFAQHRRIHAGLKPFASPSEGGGLLIATIMSGVEVAYDNREKGSFKSPFATRNNTSLHEQDCQAMSGSGDSIPQQER